MPPRTIAPELQFVDLTTVDGRNDVRKVSLHREERLHWIDISILKIRPGKNKKTFNWRIQKEGQSEVDYEKQLGIPELADAIYKSNGPDDAIRGDFKDGLFWITGGERRFRAIRYIVETLGLAEYPNGEKTTVVEIYQNPKGFTDADRRRIIFTSQNQLKYSPLEFAYGFLEVKEEEGKTHEQIADEFGVSRQTVDNYIAVTKLDKEIQEEIEAGRLPLSTALKLDRKQKNDEKKSKSVENEIPNPPTPWRKEKSDADLENDELMDKQDNTVSSPSTRLQEDKSSAAIVYNEPEEEIWKRAIKMTSALQEQGKSPEFIIAELKLNFAISNRKL